MPILRNFISCLIHCGIGTRKWVPTNLSCFRTWKCVGIGTFLAQLSFVKKMTSHLLIIPLNACQNVIPSCHPYQLIVLKMHFYCRTVPLNPLFWVKVIPGQKASIFISIIIVFKVQTINCVSFSGVYHTYRRTTCIPLFLSKINTVWCFQIRFLCG